MKNILELLTIDSKTADQQDAIDNAIAMRDAVDQVILDYKTELRGIMGDQRKAINGLNKAVKSDTFNAKSFVTDALVMPDVKVMVLKRKIQSAQKWKKALFEGVELPDVDINLDELDA